ncbi:hypothetical protein ACQ4PT_044864 [Festuca glaucescens]
MGKKKKRSGGSGGGQQQQQQQEHAAEERDEKACADAEKGDDGSGCEGKDKDKEKAGDDKDKDKEKGAGACKDEKGKGKEKKAPPPLPVVTAVLKVDMHCDGCAHRIRASVRRYAGVEGVAMEVEKGSMTVVGRFDAKKLRDRVAHKTRKKVDLVGNNNSNKGGGDKGGGGDQKGNDGEGKPEKKEDEGKEHDKGGKDQDDKCGGGGNAGKGKGGKDNKKPAVPVIVTVVLKIGSVGLHCDGCMHRIRSKLFKIKGVEQVRMDLPKNQVTVIGTMDAKCLPEKLRKKLKRPVDVVPPGKDKDKDKDGKQQQGEGGNKDGGKQQGDCKDGKQSKEAAELALWKTAYYDSQALQATQFLLSDENPNACAVM